MSEAPPYSQAFVEALIAKFAVNPDFPGLAEIVSDELMSFRDAFLASKHFPSTPADLRRYASEVKSALERLHKALGGNRGDGMSTLPVESGAKLVQMLAHHALGRSHGVGVFARAEKLDAQAVEALSGNEELPEQMVTIMRSLTHLHAAATYLQTERGPQFRQDFHGGGDVAFREWIKNLLRLYKNLADKPPTGSSSLSTASFAFEFIRAAIRVQVSEAEMDDSKLFNRFDEVMRPRSKRQAAVPGKVSRK